MKAVLAVTAIALAVAAAPAPKLEFSGCTGPEPCTLCTNFGHPNYGPTGTIMCYRHLPGGAGTLIQCVGDESVAAALKIPPCSAFFKK